MKKIVLAALTAAVTAGTAAANDYSAAMQQYLEAEIMAWVSDPVLIDAVRSQNARTAGLSQADIDRMDLDWRAELGSGTTPTITPVIDNDAAQFLRDRITAAGGTITEVFVMDARGLNVAASEPTSDYWQGDEDKFSKTFGMGAGSVHFGDIEFDESAQRYQGQVSVALTDPETRDVVGAITIGLDADALF